MQFQYNFLDFVVQKGNEVCIHRFGENVPAFCFENISELLQMCRKTSTLRFCASCLLFESTWGQNVGNRRTKIEFLIE